MKLEQNLTVRVLYLMAFIYGVLGLAFGVFYREFTKHHQYEGSTQLSVLHTHALVLGAFLFLIVLLLNHSFKIGKRKSFLYWIITYDLGLFGVLVTMLIRGLDQVLDWELSGFNHIAGLFHTILGIAVIWFFILLGKSIDFNEHSDN